MAMFNADLDSMLDVFVPDTETEVISPIVYMVGGFGGLLPGMAYSNINSRSLPPALFNPICYRPSRM
jgi:hypothetical protein